MEDNIFKQARSLINESLIKQLFSSTGAYTNEGEYWTLSPIRNDTKIGSFSINLTDGTYFDFASQDKGDFIDLVAQSRHIKPIEAARFIVGDNRLVREKQPIINKPSKDKKKDLPPMQPTIPDTKEMRASISTAVKDFVSRKSGNPEKIYKYCDYDGNWLFSILRYNTDRGKQMSPVYLSTDNNWIFRKPPIDKFLPFGIEKIKGNNLPILIVEGEKCGQCEVPGYIVLSWMGGTAAIKKTDWSLIQDRESLTWPDADSQKIKDQDVLLPKKDQPGVKAALYIRSQLGNNSVLDIYHYKNIEDNPNGWDLADCIQEGIDPLSVIKACQPKNDIEVAIDSYEVYKKFIDVFYDENNLEQNAGIYWEYLKDKHYWKTAEKRDILCNMQRWMEETNLHLYVTEKTKPTTFFNEMKQYIETHSVGYINDNPFKNSAIIPYLHVQNGAIHVTKEGSEFIHRDNAGEDFFKKLFPINCLDFNYDDKYNDDFDMDDECPAFNFFLNEVMPKELHATLHKDDFDKELSRTKMMFAQILAYSLIPIKPNEYNFGLLGNQRSGKSFFMKIVKSLVGSDFCVERRIADMDSRFVGADLWGKKVFIEPDLKTRQQLPEDFIKAYAGEQEVTAEFKNKTPISGVKTSLALFFVSNYEFSVKGTEGIERRFIIVNFKNKIENPDTTLLDKILGKTAKGKESGEHEGQTFDERPGILGFALKGWDQFIKDGFNFTLPNWATDDKDKWMQESNSVSSFMYDHYLSSSDNGQTITRSDLYNEYKDWCDDEGKKPMGKKNCFAEVRRLPGIIEDEVMRSFKISKEYKDEIPF